MDGFISKGTPPSCAARPIRTSERFYPKRNSMPRTRSLAWSELKIGIITIVALAMAATLIFLLGGDTGFFWQQYRLKTVFADISGLKAGAPVRVAGLEVGSVSDLEFIGDRVEVVMEIKEEHRERNTTETRARPRPGLPP